MEFIPYAMLALGLAIWTSAFLLHGRSDRRTIERRLDELRRHKEER